MASVNDPRPLGLQQPVVFREVALVGSSSISDVPSAPTLSVGTGSPDTSLTRPQGSVFLRTDGAADTSLYVNTDGATAWSAVQAGGAGADAITDTNNYFTTDTIDGAFDALGVQIGGDDDATFAFAEDNVLADDDAVYAALDKLDLKWGDLASTANTEGASLVGVEDSAGNFTGGDVEAVLQELGNLSHLRVAQVTIPGGDGAGNAGDLSSTTVEVVAAPPAGVYVEVQSVRAWLDYNSAAYDTAGNLTLEYSGGDTITDAIAGAGFNDQASDQHRIAYPVSDVDPQAATAVHVKTSADWYGAAGDSPLKLEVKYRMRLLEW